MKDYKPKKYKKLPQDVYNRALWTIRSYERLERELEDMIHEKHVTEVPVKNRDAGNPTAKIAERREKKLAEVKAIDKAFNTIPPEYQGMIEDNIKYYTPMYEMAGVSESTLTRYRMRVVIEVAHNTGLIDDIEYINALDGEK